MTQFNVIVLHGEFPGRLSEDLSLVNHTPIAQITVDTVEDDLEQICEHAWGRTQNICGSWSRPGNADHRPGTLVLKPLETHNGQEYGHRSSMVGDMFLVTANGIKPQMFVADSFGFKKVK